MDAAFLRGLTQRRLSRRALLRISGLSAATMVIAAACGVKGQSGDNKPLTVEEFWTGKTRNGKLNWANWPLYMDTESYPEVSIFEDETGIDVTYDEVINDNAQWFARNQPDLAAGRSIGYDLMVISHGIEFRNFVRSGFLAPLDHSKLPSFASNAASQYKNSAYDPGNVYSIPWASGFTGIVYDPEKTGRPITKLADLWDPAFAGHVSMPSDLQELANFGLLVLGIDPATSTPADWAAAAAKLQEQKDAGIVRNYSKQDYIQDLTDGNTWVGWAWSGDIYQLNVANGTNYQFVLPEEGANLFVDNFTIPVTAENPVDALEMIDFFYRPEIAASIIEWHAYISPVPEAKDVFTQNAAEAETDEDKEWYEGLVANPLVFPDAATFAKAHPFVDPVPAQVQEFLSTFSAITL